MTPAYIGCLVQPVQPVFFELIGCIACGCWTCCMTRKPSIVWTWSCSQNRLQDVQKHVERWSNSICHAGFSFLTVNCSLKVAPLEKNVCTPICQLAYWHSQAMRSSGSWHWTVMLTHHQKKGETPHRTQASQNEIQETEDAKWDKVSPFYVSAAIHFQNRPITWLVCVPLVLLGGNAMECLSNLALRWCFNRAFWCHPILIISIPAMMFWWRNWNRARRQFGRWSWRSAFWEVNDTS